MKGNYRSWNLTLFSDSGAAPGGVFSPRRGDLRVPPILLLAVELTATEPKVTCARGHAWHLGSFSLFPAGGCA